MNIKEVINQPKNKTAITNFAIFLCAIVLIASSFLALWNNGTLFPSWVKWHSFAVQGDINGNSQIETAKLTNRHLSITDSEGRQYITPDDWLVADAEIGDVTGDGTPEVMVLVWIQNASQEDAAFRLPLLQSSPGFSEYIYLFDYENGNVTPIWNSDPLYIEAVSATISSSGDIRLEDSNGNVTNWTWRNPGFGLNDADIPSSLSNMLQ